MNAVIRVGTHQYHVTSGQTVTMEKLDGPVGSEVRFKDILLLTDGTQVSVGGAVAGTVLGKITSQFRGDKILVFKKKRRKGYRRTQGHRQGYTKVEITKIEG